jgi:hypothetical protein
MVKDMAETAAEVVEDVAAAAEKVSAEVSGQLPEDGRLRHAAVLVEHASHEVAEEARLAQDIIHKVVPMSNHFLQAVSPPYIKVEGISVCLVDVQIRRGMGWTRFWG